MPGDCRGSFLCAGRRVGNLHADRAAEEDACRTTVPGESGLDRVRRIISGIPSLEGALSRVGSGWNGGRGVDMQTLRATLIERQASAKRRKADDAWRRRKEERGGGGGEAGGWGRGGAGAHACTVLCRKLGLEEELDEERREEEAIAVVLSVSDEAIYGTASAFSDALRSVFGVPRPSSEGHSCDEEIGTAVGDIESQWESQVMGLLGWGADALRRDMAEAGPAYSAYAKRTVKGAPKVMTPFVLPFEAWYLTEWDALRVVPSLHVARACAASLVGVAREGRSKEVLQALGRLSTGGSEVAARAAQLISEAKGHPAEVTRNRP